MAQTHRSQADLLNNLFPDGLSDNSIRAVDIRDLITSMVPGHIGVHVSSAVETVISGAGAFVKALGTTALIGTAHHFTMAANNRLTYTGSVLAHCFFNVTMTVSTAANNKIVAARLAVNGATLADTQVDQSIVGSSDQGALSLLGSAELNPNDFVEVFVANITDNTNLTVDHMWFHSTSNVE